MSQQPEACISSTSALRERIARGVPYLFSMLVRFKDSPTLDEELRMEFRRNPDAYYDDVVFALGGLVAGYKPRDVFPAVRVVFSELEDDPGRQQELVMAWDGARERQGRAADKVDQALILPYNTQ